MPRTQCCVPMCLGRGGHTFPCDPSLKDLWLIAIRRNPVRSTELTKWTPSTHSVVCKAHFKPDDYNSATYHGTSRVNQRLISGAVPSVFSWTEAKSASASSRAARLQQRLQLHDQEPDLAQEDLYEEIVGTDASESATLPVPPPQFISTSAQTSEAQLPPLCIEKLMLQEDALHYYTGLECYKRFLYVLASLGPAAYKLNYRWANSTELSIQNQFLLTLVRLRLYSPYQELAYLFGISKFAVGNIYLTWVNFMYHQWKEIDTWPDQQLTRFFIPSSFKKLYPKTRIILDGVEIPVKKPKKPTAQQATYSTYKNRNTLKAVVGATPGGLVSHIPNVYGGSASDRALVERSGLTSMLDGNDDIMVDKGFNVQDLFAPFNVKVNMPTFLRKRTQFSQATKLNDRKVASKRVHIERLIGLAKTYKSLTTPLNSVDTALGNELLYICFMLCNFRTCIVPKTA